MKRMLPLVLLGLLLLASASRAGVVPPTLTPAGPQHYADYITIAIETPTPGARLRYTTNGMEPTATYGALIDTPSGKVILDQTATLKVVAFIEGGPVSAIEGGFYQRTNPDSDGDGLDDSVEATLGTNSRVADSDGDNYGDGYEVAKGSSPVDKADVPVESNEKSPPECFIPDSSETMAG